MPRISAWRCRSCKRRRKEASSHLPFGGLKSGRRSCRGDPAFPAPGQRVLPSGSDRGRCVAQTEQRRIATGHATWESFFPGTARRPSSSREEGEKGVGRGLEAVLL